MKWSSSSHGGGARQRAVELNDSGCRARVDPIFVHDAFDAWALAGGIQLLAMRHCGLLAGGLASRDSVMLAQPRRVRP